MESVFRIGDRLGAGGGGEVFRAVDTRLNRPVAIKFLKGGDEREVARFRREAQLAGRLSNPNIAAIYEVGDLDGRPFIAMQLVEGRTLHGWQGTARDAVAMITVAARAVAFAHEQGIIHRDVKPDNLMVDGAGRIYVMDFGLARVAEGASSLSATGGIVGTPSYMSPEQARGERVDARADVWSLGATLYELLSGVPPFQAPNLMQLLARLQEAEPPPLRAVDAALAAIVRRCLEKEPSHRYATAAALADDLDRWARGEPIQARRRLPLRAIALVALAATALLSTVLFLRVSGSREAAARETLLANLRRTADTTLRAALELRRTGRTDAMEAQGAGFVEAATQAMRIAPDLAEPHHLMGRFHRARMRFPDAAAAQAEALRRDPGHVGALYESLFLELRETLAILPRKLEAAQRSATALTSDAELRQTLDRVAAKASHLSGAGLPPGRRECVLGFAALLRRDRACVEHLRRALQHDPDLEEARELLASFLLTCGRPEEAFEVCDGGVARDAGYAPFRYDRAGALLEIARRAVDPARSAGPAAAALADLDELIRLVPSVVALVRRAQVRQFLGNSAAEPVPHYERALADLQAALDRAPANPEILALAGAVRRDWASRRPDGSVQRLHRALEDLDRALALIPDDTTTRVTRASVRSMIAKASVDAGAFAEAEADYAEAAKRDPSNPEPLVLLANERLEWCGLLQSRGRDDPAIRARVIEEMTALLAREPPPPRAWLIRGQALTQRGTLAVAAGRPGLDDLGAAMRDYDAYLKAHPGDRLGRLFRTHALCESALAVGGEEGSTRFAEAVAEYSDLLARSPGDATIVKLRADARVNWAGNRAALKLDSIPLLREAIADYSEVIRQSPGQPRAWFGRGAARKNLALRSKSADDEWDALIDFLKAVELDPDYVDALVEAGRIHERRASIASKEGRSPIPDADAAIPYLERALRLARDNAGAWRALGHARMFRAQGLLGARKIADDDLRAAAAAYEAALALRPDYNDARINLETCRRLLKRE